MSEVELDPLGEASCTIGDLENKIIDENFSNQIDDFDWITNLERKVVEKCYIGATMMTIGSTNLLKGKYPLEDDETFPTDEESDFSSDDNSEPPDDASYISSLSEESFDDWEDRLECQLDIDAIMTSATHARQRSSLSAKLLSKVWRIDPDDAEHTLEVTSQHMGRTDNPSLKKNYTTNDCTLRYKRIKEFFCMGTFYAMKNAGKSSRGHTCCQLFVTDKGFVYVVPMQKENEVMLAIKEFVKAVDAPDAIICDHLQAQPSSSIRKFCGENGTTLQVLEKGTPWANRAKLYIGLMKGAVSKDMKESNSPLIFWDYCLECCARINNLTAKNLFQLHGTNAYTQLTGEEGDISILCQCQWYE
eukprot:10349584-Ditylum_brightwellii.AAC.1